MRWGFCFLLLVFVSIMILWSPFRTRRESETRFAQRGKKKKPQKYALHVPPELIHGGLWYCRALPPLLFAGADASGVRRGRWVLPNQPAHPSPTGVIQSWGSCYTDPVDKRAQVPAWHYISTYLFCTTASNEKHTKSGSIPMWPEIPQRDTAVAHPSRRLDCATWASGIFHGAACRVSGKQWQRYHLYTLHRKRQWGNWDGSRRGKHWGWDAKFSTHTTQESLGTPQ